MKWRITENYYDKKRKEYRAKQKEVETKMSKLRFADEEYYLTSEYILKLSSKAGQLFESSEQKEKKDTFEDGTSEPCVRWQKSPI